MPALAPFGRGIAGLAQPALGVMFSPTPVAPVTGLTASYDASTRVVPAGGAAL